jgi:hypothetical protein
VTVSGDCAADPVPYKLNERQEMQAFYTWQWANEGGSNVTLEEVSDVGDV